MWLKHSQKVINTERGAGDIDRETSGKTGTKRERKRERQILNDTFKEVIRLEPQSF